MSEPLDIVEVLRRPLKTISHCRRMLYVTAEVAEIAAAEIIRLREERKPVAWCVQAAAGSMFHAWTHTPIDAAVLIQCKDEADARMMASVYGHKVLGVVDLDAKEVPRD